MTEFKELEVQAPSAPGSLPELIVITVRRQRSMCFQHTAVMRDAWLTLYCDPSHNVIHPSR